MDSRALAFIRGQFPVRNLRAFGIHWFPDSLFAAALLRDIGVLAVPRLSSCLALISVVNQLHSILPKRKPITRLQLAASNLLPVNECTVRTVQVDNGIALGSFDKFRVAARHI